MNYRILYFASLRDSAGRDREDCVTSTADARALYVELREQHGFELGHECLRVAINGEFARWDSALADGDEIAFLPPVSGG